MIAVSPIWLEAVGQDFDVFRETASGAGAYRAQLRKARDSRAAGDVLFVTQLDRHARSTHDLLSALAAIADRQAGFKSLGAHGPTPRRHTTA